MTFRYNENDIGTSGANNLLLLDENGKIPAVDGSALTNISASGFNGLSYAYTSYNSTDLTPDIDTYYYISQANKTNALGGNEVNINVPYNSDIINGSKFGFSYIHTGGALNGNRYTLTTPLNSSLSAQGWTSFTLNIHGKEFSNGEVYTSDYSANPSRELYAFVDGTNLTLFTIKGGNSKIADLVNMDINQTTPYNSNAQLIVTKNSSTYGATDGNTNTPKVSAKQFTANTTLSFANTTLPDGYREYFVTCNNTSGVNPTLTLPLITGAEGIFIQFYTCAYYGSNTTNYSNFTISRQSTNVIRYASTGATLNTYSTTIARCGILFSDGTNWYGAVVKGINDAQTY